MQASGSTSRDFHTCTSSLLFLYIMCNSRTSVCAQLMVDLNLERSTWQLLHALYIDRINTQLLGEDDWEQEAMATDLTVSMANSTILTLVSMEPHSYGPQLSSFSN